MSSKNGYVSREVAKGLPVRKILKGGEKSLLDGYVVQNLELVEGLGLRLITAARQPHSPGGKFPAQIMTAQEVYVTGNPDGKIGRLALAGEPVLICPDEAPLSAAAADATHGLIRHARFS